MKKLLANITMSNKELKGRRGSQLVELLEMGHSAIVSKLKYDVMNLEQKIEDHQDFNPSHTTQLKFDKPADTEQWATQLHEMKVQLFIKKRDLEIAEETTEELFTDVEERNSKGQFKSTKDSKTQEGAS